MKSELFHIGPFTVYGYGLMIALAILSAFFSASWRARKKGLDEDFVVCLVIWCALGGLLGAKLLFWLVNIRYILADPGYLLETLSDGFVVYGGIIGGILAGILCCSTYKKRFLPYFDLAMPSIALAQGFGRIGCLLAGCCYGKETSFPLAITFKTSSYAPNNVPLIPTQIYSAAFDFALFLLLVWLSGRQKKEGQTGAAYLIFYGIGRFIIEFFRGDLERGGLLGLSTSQIISIFILLAGILLLGLLRKQKL